MHLVLVRVCSEKITNLSKRGNRAVQKYILQYRKALSYTGRKCSAQVEWCFIQPVHFLLWKMKRALNIFLITVQIWNLLILNHTKDLLGALLILIMIISIILTNVWEYSHIKCMAKDILLHSLKRIIQMTLIIHIIQEEHLILKFQMS